MIVLFWLFLAFASASPIVLQILNHEELDLPADLVIGSANNFVKEEEIIIIQDRLNTWKTTFFSGKVAQVGEVGDFINASFRSFRKKSYSFEEQAVEVLFTGQVLELMQYFSAQIKKDTVLKKTWSKCTFYEHPRIKTTKRNDNSNFRLQLGRSYVRVFFEDQYENMNVVEYEHRSTTPPPGELSPVLKLTDIYGAPKSSLKEKLIRQKSREESVCDSCTIS